MKKINGYKYSRKSFEGYEYRATALFDKDNQEHKLDIYTTDFDKYRVIKNLKDSTKKGVTFTKIVTWVTKKQDDVISEMLDNDDWFKED